MWYARHHGFGFQFDFPPYGFIFRGMRPFPRRSEYLKMLEEYKKNWKKS